MSYYPQFKICCPASCKLSRQIAFGEIELNLKNLNLPQDLSIYTLQFITCNDSMKQLINHTYNLKIKGLDFYWNIRINDFVPFHFLLALSCRQKICINQDMADYILSFLKSVLTHLVSHYVIYWVIISCSVIRVV